MRSFHRIMYFVVVEVDDKIMEDHDRNVICDHRQYELIERHMVRFVFEWWEFVTLRCRIVTQFTCSTVFIDVNSNACSLFIEMNCSDQCACCIAVNWERLSDEIRIRKEFARCERYTDHNRDSYVNHFDNRIRLSGYLFRICNGRCWLYMCILISECWVGNIHSIELVEGGQRASRRARWSFIQWRKTCLSYAGYNCNSFFDKMKGAWTRNHVGSLGCV